MEENNMERKKNLEYVSCLFIVTLFLASITTVNAEISPNVSMKQSGSLTPHPVLSDIEDCGFVASYSTVASAYAYPWVHTGVPLADPGDPQQGQGLDATVILEELRSDHPQYRIEPSIITYYLENGQWVPWVHSPLPIIVPEDQVIPETEYHFGVYLSTHEDKIVPFRTSITVSENIDGEWVVIDNAESCIGLWFMDVSPYTFAYPMPVSHIHQSLNHLIR